MARSPKSVRRLLQNKPTLKSLDREVAAQTELLTQIRQCLPSDLARHCRHAQMHETRVTLHVDSPVWATRFRFITTELLSVLKHAYPRLREIKVKLLVERHASPGRTHSACRSEAAASHLRETADHTENRQLRSALLRLSKAVRPS